MCVHVHRLCHITCLAMGSTRAGHGKYTVKYVIQSHMNVKISPNIMLKVCHILTHYSETGQALYKESHDLITKEYAL